MHSITNLFSPEFTAMMIRFAICLIVNWLIIHFLYYRKSKRREFYFTFLLTSIAIFFLVFFMTFGLDKLGGKTSMGIGIGLFGIFSIMRFRTDAMPVREMTYLFVIVSLSVVNAIGDAVSTAEILVTDFIVALVIWCIETFMKFKPCKLIQYDRIELIKPDRREDLIHDLEERLGLHIINVEVGGVNFLKDMAVLKVYYTNGTKDEATNSVDDKVRLKATEYRDSLN